MFAAFIGAIASVATLFGTVGYIVGVKEGIRREKERVQLASLTARAEINTEEVKLHNE